MVEPTYALIPLVRLFLAINLTPEVRHAVHGATAPLREAAPKLTWVREPCLHMTVKFLGEQPDTMHERVRDAITPVVGRHHEIEATVGGVGAFPNFRDPKVVWMGVTPEPKLELLHHEVEEACADLGFELDGRAFRPHVTLARFKSRKADANTVRALTRAAQQIDFSEEVLIASIDLMQSDLTTNGPRYMVLSSALLQPSLE